MVPLQADLTREDPAIYQFMAEKLKHPSKSLPLIAIIPAQNPDQATIFNLDSGFVTERMILDALRKAGRSAAGTSPSPLAMR